MSHRTLLRLGSQPWLAVLLGTVWSMTWFLAGAPLPGPLGHAELRAAESGEGESDEARADVVGDALEPMFADEQLEYFERRVRPLLVEHCYACHSGENDEATRGGLRLDSRAAVLEGGDTGPSVVPGHPEDSLLIDAIEYGDLYQMPPKSKLRDEEIEVLRRWVSMGAPWPPAVSGEGKRLAAGRFDVAARRQEHWAWQPLARPELPAVRLESWVQDPLDRFVLADLETRGMEPAEPAPPRTLIRRLYFDLLGLPPSPEEVERFVADPSPAAYARLVDRLLESPHFGERWGRHWLDLVRYAESRGHEFDYDAANAYQYRDYVIRALNADVPYDQWMIEHVAGDLLESPRLHPQEGFNESILGTGFWFLGEWVHSPVDIRLDECERFDNMLDVFSKTFLGLTVACARCHDHKFDAIPQSDYYALFGFLQSSGYRQAPFDTLEHHREVAGGLAELGRRAGREAGEAVAVPRQEAVVHLAACLLAAREGLANALSIRTVDRASLQDPEQELPEAAREALAAAAARHQVPLERVQRWAQHFRGAGRDPADPFFLWGKFLQTADADGEEAAAAVRNWVAQQQTLAPAPHVSTSLELADQDVVLDFRGTVAELGGEHAEEARLWLTDGYAFGLGPRSAGMLELTTTDDVEARFRLHGAAHRDPFWKGLGLAEQVASESGRLGSWPRAGQIFRTPSFLVRHGPVHYLVRGSGVAYAAVNSHIMLAGPLHGRLVMEFKMPEDGDLRWVTHDLSRYRDHRAHIEFHPVDDRPLEIVAVIQSPQAPPLPEARPARGLVPWLETLGEQATWDDVARRYQAGFAQLMDEIRSGQLLAEPHQVTASSAASRDAAEVPAGAAAADDSEPSTCGPSLADRAALANWCLAEGTLWGSRAAAELVREAHTAYRTQRRQLAEAVRWQSRTAPAMWEGTGMDERLMIRGNHRTLGEVVPRRFLTAIAGEDQPAIPSGSGRAQLAQWLVDPANPFPSRVMVNRIWHHLTGRGLVASTDNLGVLGEEPTHPELLDHLATGLIDQGWSLKQMIRRVVLSSTYQMSSAPRPEEDRLDPEARGLHRMRIRRLEGEAIRDTLLTLAGRLDPSLYGPSVPVYLTEFMQGRGRPGKSGPLDGHGRRSLYIAVRRNFLSPMMLAFDTPQPFSSVGRRNVSNVPAQALILMNDPLVTQLARQWAERVLAESPGSAEAGVQRMYLEAFSRPAKGAELRAALDFLADDDTDTSSAGPGRFEQVEAWAEYAHVLMNVKELIFVE